VICDFSQFAICAQFAIFSQSAICDCSQFAICAQFAVNKKSQIANCEKIANCTQFAICEKLRAEIIDCDCAAVAKIRNFSASFSSFIAPFFDLFESRNIYNEIYSSNLEIKSLTEI
jgi:hypothetical protein